MPKRKPRVGRPPKGEHKRSKPLMVRLTKAEFASVDIKRGDKPMSVYAREKVLE